MGVVLPAMPACGNRIGSSINQHGFRIGTCQQLLLTELKLLHKNGLLMKAFLPELIVLALFLSVDLLYNGLTLAVAGVAAGLSAFFILLVFKKKKPGLILEGIFFGGVTAIGEFVDYPGGSLILIELLLGATLVLSALAGKNILSGMAGGLGKGLFSPQQSGILSSSIGSVFLVHSVVCTVLSILGHLDLAIGAVSFAVFYAIALKISSGKMKSAVRNTLPLLVQEPGEFFRLECGGKVTGRIRLESEAGIVSVSGIVSAQLPLHEFLEQMEIALKRKGALIISIRNWPGDEIELEMRGYTSFSGEWRKRLNRV
jgi:hypothetical protein